MTSNDERFRLLSTTIRCGEGMVSILSSTFFEHTSTWYSEVSEKPRGLSVALFESCDGKELS